MKQFQFLKIALLLFITSCNNSNQTANTSSENTPVTVDSSTPTILTPDTSKTISLQPDTSKEIYCAFIEGSWSVVGTSLKNASTFTESVRFKCKDFKVVMKTPSLVSILVRQGEAVGSMYSLTSKDYTGDKYSISLERDGNGMKGYLKQSFHSGNESFYSLKFRR